MPRFEITMVCPAAVLFALVLAATGEGVAGEPWPAESRAAAVDIGAALVGGEPSAAAWHEGLGRLFIVDDSGRIFHMNPDGSDSIVIDGLPADIEAAFALPGDDDHIFVGLENPPTLLRVVIDTGATNGQWLLPGMTVGASNERLESLAFLPDSSAGAIRGTNEQPYNGGAGSVFATGGLVLAGHQGNGRLYVFDVDLNSADAPIAVNSYGPFLDGPTTLLDLSDLDFHTATGMVYALWDDPIEGVEQGRLGLLDPALEFAVVTIWNTAVDSFGEEGFALLDSGFGDGLSRAVIAEDEVNDHSVYLYSFFAVPGAETTTTTTTLPGTTCGDPSGDMAITATDALMVLYAAVGSLACPVCLCDLDGSGTTTAVDALRALKIAVGEPLALLCPACAP